MALNVWDPFGTLAWFDREFDDIVRRAWGTTLPAGRGISRYVPPVDIARDGEDALLTLELPGVDVDNDVDIEVAPGRLTVTGRREERATSENGRSSVRELRYGEFRRDFALPEGISPDDVAAAYDKGLLEIRVKGAARPAVESRKIAVSKGSTRKAVEAGK